jgi:putative spermidine/putrescine transport system permease protein
VVRVLAILVAGYLVLPSLIVVPLSFTDRPSFAFPPRGWSLRYYETFLTDPRWRDALLTSAALAVVVTVVATVLGTAAAFGLIRGRFPGRSAVSAVLLAPMILPGIVAAVAIFAIFLRWTLVGTFTGFVLAHTVLALPFVVVTVTANLRTVDRRLELAAATLGTGPWATFRLVTLPLIRPAILSGAVFAFVTSFDEVVIALYIQSPTMRTLPVQMFTSVTSEVDPTIAAASSLILVITSALILVPQLTRKAGTRA